MDPLLKLLASDASMATPRLAAMLGVTEAEIRSRIRAAEQEGLILGYRAVLNDEKLGRDLVRAIIEVRITPERGGDSTSSPTASPATRRSAPAI